MPTLARQRWFRYAFAGVVMLVGSTATAGLMVVLHSGVLEREESNLDDAIAFDTPPPQKKPPQKKPKPKPQPKPQPSKAPPPPSMGSALAGLSFGLPQFTGDLLGGASDGMLGDRSDAVMSDDAVDEPPQPVTRTTCEFPARAQQRNISGFVVLSLLVQSDGSLSDVRILESEPPGLFDSYAMSCIRNWRFEPATYEGRAVAVRARQKLSWKMD